MQSKRLLLYLFLLLFAATAGGWFVAKNYLARLNEEPPLRLPDNITATGVFHGAGAADNVTATIFYPSDKPSEGAPDGNTAKDPNEGLSSEEIKVPYDPLQVKLAEEIIPEYLKRLQGGLRDTKLLGVYRDRENVLYLDLSDDFRKNLSGDARQEYYLLKSLFKTLTAGIPGLTDVKVLLEGREVESLGGHFLTLYPLGGFLSEQAPNPAVPAPRS